MRRLAPALPALLLLAAPARAGRWASLAAAAGASERELGIRAERFETSLTLPSVERLLDDPAAGFDEAEGWGARLSSAPALSGPLALGAELLAAEPPAGAGPGVAARADLAGCRGLPSGLLPALTALSAAVEEARADARRLSSVYSDAERARLLAAFGGWVRHEPLAAVTREDVALAARFDAAGIAAAGARLAARVEEQLPALSAAAAKAPAGRWRCGGVLVGGAGDDAYAEADLAGTALLVDLGGRNRYDSAAAAAGPGEARVVVDLGGELVFSSTRPAFGAARFGVALLYAPATGRKRVQAGDESLGAALFGAAGARLAGPVEARTAHFGQGAAAFGAGAFVVSGASSTLSADYASQGFGMTRGAGLLVARGAGLRADCGLRHPDPREAQAMISLCQGVGEGPRAYAAGGVGLALVDGPGAALRGSYFAQGAGYWHAFGALYERGDGSSAQARRYSQGAGVHAGAGLLSWRGDDGRVVTWGVGPAYGWDFGVGMLSLKGDRNALRADWASGDGDADGRSLAEIEGRDNRLRLPDWGLATYKRAASGYALSRVAGAGTRLWAPALGGRRTGPLQASVAPWGATLLTDGAALDEAVDVATAAWPAVERAADAAQDARADAAALAQADSLPEAERPARWLAVAARESLDQGAAVSAAGRLMSLPREDARYVVRALSVEAFDEALWARLAAAAAGAEAAREAAEELPRERGLRRALLVDIMRYGGADRAVPAALSLLKDPDWRLRRSGAGQLGAALGADAGEEPGRLRFLAQSLALIRSTAPVDMGSRRLFDLYAVASLDPQLSARDRLALLWASGSPFDPVAPQAKALFAELLRRKAGVYAPALELELARSRALVPEARRALREALKDRDPDVRATAAVSLGALGDARDAGALVVMLLDEDAAARDGAASGLAHLGEGARVVLEGAFAAPQAPVRRLAALAAAQSADEGVTRLLRRGFADKDASVRAASAAALSAVQAPYMTGVRHAVLAELQRQAASDPDPSAAAAAARQLGRLGRE